MRCWQWTQLRKPETALHGRRLASVATGKDLKRSCCWPHVLPSSLCSAREEETSRPWKGRDTVTQCYPGNRKSRRSTWCQPALRTLSPRQDALGKQTHLLLKRRGEQEVLPPICCCSFLRKSTLEAWICLPLWNAHDNEEGKIRKSKWKVMDSPPEVQQET